MLSRLGRVALRFSEGMLSLLSLTDTPSQIMKRIALWSLILIGIGLAVWGMAKFATSSGSQPYLIARAISETDWVKGNREASVVLIEYSDLQCPACAAYAPIVNRITEEFSDRIAFVYRHFPLPQHQNAELASRATEAAGKQGKFWEMVDQIFANQNTWANERNAQEVFRAYAQSIGLDVAQFENDRNSREIKNKIENDYLSGIQSRINSTPTFFLNGEKIQPQNYEEFRNLILQKLNPHP